MLKSIDSGKVNLSSLFVGVHAFFYRRTYNINTSC